MTRDRSACESTRLSNSATRRTGAGTSPPGRGAEGRSNSSAPLLVAEGDQGWPELLHDRLQPGQPGPGRPRRGRSPGRTRPGTASPGPRVPAAGAGAFPAAGTAGQASVPPRCAGPARSGPRRRAAGPARAARARARPVPAPAAGWSGQRPASAWPSSLNVSGSASTRARPSAASAAGSTPASCLPKEPRRPRSITGWTSRRTRQAVPGGDQVDGAAHQRDPDHVPAGEQCREVIGNEPVEPRVQAVVGGERRLGLQPDEVLDGLHHLRRPA
jgi:hypothetical protein